MVDRNLYLVDFEIIRQRYTHLGIYGKGRDAILDIPSTIHILQEKFIYPGAKAGKLVSMQIFSSLSSDLLQRKLDQLVKAAYLFYVPCYKKNEDKTFDFMVLYDFDGLIPLEDLVKEKKQKNEKFAEEEVWEIIHLLIDSMYQGSRLNYEYTDISPVNIFVRGSDQGAKKQYVISNFGLQLPKKFEKRVQCLSDRFYQNKINIIGKVMDLYIKSFMFQVGMIALYLLTLEEPNTLYQDFYNQDTKKLNQTMLQKRIDTVQESGYSNQLLNLLNGLLQIREDERLDLEELMTADGAKLLQREVQYYQGKLADAQSFSGFVEVKGEERVPHGAGDILTNEGQYYKGMFSHGNIDGYGIWHDGLKKYAFGKWDQDVLKEGMLINKNEYLFYGSISNFEPAAVGVLVNVAVNQVENYFYFEGSFTENHLPHEGHTFLKNGKLVPGVPSQSMTGQINKEEPSQLQQSPKQSIEMVEEK